MIFDLQPVLQSELVLLRPLKEEDLESLYEAASDPLIWEQHPDKRWQRPVFEAFFRGAMDSKGALVVVDKKSGKIIGTSRFSQVKETQHAVEIGWTFLARQYWGGPYNKDIKSLMMKHAFRYVPHVVFYIHENNMRSRKAVEKIGGKEITHLDNQPLPTRSNANVIYVVSAQPPK
jgi:N-acetyltransferase